MKGHVTVEKTKKSIKLQMIYSVLMFCLGVLAFFLSIATESGFLFLIAVFGVFGAIAWSAVFIPLQKWWHHG